MRNNTGMVSMRRDGSNASKYVHLPPRAITVSVEEYTRRMRSPQHLTMGIADIDERVIPPMPGDLISIIGRPGMGKTSYMIRIAQRYAEIANAGKTGYARPIFLYATWETTVEEFVGVFAAAKSGYTLEHIGRGTADMGAIKRSLVSMLGTSIAVFGRSMEDSRNRLPIPSLFDLQESIRYLQDDGYDVLGVFVDYLQRIPGMDHDHRAADRSSRASENLEIIKDIASYSGCFAYVGVQAKRDVDDYGGVKFPTMSDGQWTSSIEQTSDKVYGITVPGKYMAENALAVLNGWKYEIGDRTFGLKLLKQRFGPCEESDTWLLDFDMGKIILQEHRTLGEVDDNPF